MLVGRVVDDEIEDDAHTLLLALGGHRVKIFQGPVHRIDILVIRYVVAEVHLWRGKTRGNPDGIHSQVAQVAHLRGDAVQVPNAVVVAGGEAAWVQLIEDSAPPPLVSWGIWFLCRHKRGA